MKINYGIVALSNENDKMKICHFCGYEKQPTDTDKKLLEEELNTDETFGLVGRINKDVFLFNAPEDVVKLYAKEISFKVCEDKTD